MRRGPEIQDALQKFMAKWSGYSGSEKAEAQTFLNELFACYGTDRSEAGALFEDFTTSAGFMDLHWPGTLIVEMKAPYISLEKTCEQRQRYRLESSNYAENIPAARFVIAPGVARDCTTRPSRSHGSRPARALQAGPGVRLAPSPDAG